MIQTWEGKSGGLEVWRFGGLRTKRSGVSRIGGIEDDLAMGQDVRGLAVVDHGRRHQPKARVVVLVVVPLEEGLAEAASIFDGTEAIRETRAVFQGTELAFRIRIIIRNMRTAVGLGYAQIGQ